MNLVQRMDYSGGLNTSGNYNRLQPNQLIAGQNVFMSNLTGYPSPSVSKYGCLTNPPITSRVFGGVHGAHAFTTAPCKQITLATMEATDFPTESWTFTAGSDYAAAISEGDQCVSLVMSGAATATATGAVTSTGFSTGSGVTECPILVLDSNWSGVANFASGLIRIGNDASNYREWAIVATNVETGDNTLKWVWADGTDTGTPSFATGVDYVFISMTSSGNLTVKLDNLRVAAYESATHTNVNVTANTDTIWSSYLYSYQQGAMPYHVCQVGKNLYYNTSFGTSSLLPLKMGFTTNGPSNGDPHFYFSQFLNQTDTTKNILYFVNGKDGYFSWNPLATAGSRVTAISSRNYKYIISHKNHMFLAGYSTNPNAVYVSNLNAPATVQDANAIVMPGTLDENIITGFCTVGDYLYVFRTQDICVIEGSALTGSDTFSVRRLDVVHGAPSQAAICAVGDNVYHFDGNAVYLFDGVTQTPVSIPISSYMPTSMTNTWTCSLSYNPFRRCIVLYRPSYGSAFANVPTPASSYMLTMDTDTNAWFVFGGDAGYQYANVCGCTFMGTSTSVPLYTSTGTNTLKWDNQDAVITDSQTFVAQTAWDDDARPTVVKDYERAKIYIETESSQSAPSTVLTVYTDGSSTAKGGTPVTLVPSNGVIDLGFAPIYGRNISVKIQVDEVQTRGPVRVTGIAYTYTDHDGGM